MTVRSAKRTLAIIILSIDLSVSPSRHSTEPSLGEIETPRLHRMIA